MASAQVECFATGESDCFASQKAGLLLREALFLREGMGMIGRAGAWRSLEEDEAREAQEDEGNARR